MNANGFTVIRVTAPDDVRIARAIKAGDNFSENDLEHVTEQAVANFEVDYEVNNAGTVEDLQAQVDAIIAEINGFIPIQKPAT